MIICTRGAQRKYCACGRRSRFLCDFPLKGAKAGQTCDKNLCDRCRVQVVVDGKNLDYCSAHYHLSVSQKESKNVLG